MRSFPESRKWDLMKQQFLEKKVLFLQNTKTQKQKQKQKQNEQQQKKKKKYKNKNTKQKQKPEEQDIDDDEIAEEVENLRENPTRDLLESMTISLRSRPLQ